MRTALAAAAAVVGTLATVTPGMAQSPQAYPYCALDSSSGATSCYYTSRAQCGAKCIPNPSFGQSGDQAGAMARPRGRPGPPRY